MRTENVVEMACPLAVAFECGRSVQEWPRLLPHYRWVRFVQGDSTRYGVVEMAARRDFGPLRWPVWWVSEMHVDTHTPTVRYLHIAGITRGMQVEWRFRPRATSTEVSIVHEWPRPWLGRWLARQLIGPAFVHAIAGRTLAGLKQRAEALHHG